MSPFRATLKHDGSVARKQAVSLSDTDAPAAAGIRVVGAVGIGEGAGAQPAMS
jgi:hypothetical protein